MDPVPAVHIAPTTERKTTPSRFGETLRSVAAGLATGVSTSLGLAAPFVPGGLVLSAATRQLGQALTSPGGAASSSSGQSDLLEATRALQSESQSFNLQFLQLQENLQRESREFQALSNVMRMKHDSAKAILNNIH